MIRNRADGQYFSYDVYGLVTGIYDNATDRDNEEYHRVKYEYDDKGHLVKKTVYTGSFPSPTATATYYIRDIAGNLFTTYESIDEASPIQKNIAIYGATRLGFADIASGAITRYVYELTDHTGSVRATVQDDGTLLSYSDYYPFGMEMPGRSYIASGAYGYGYQGVFAEEEAVTGYNNFELRQYDSRIGRWLSTDPYGQGFSPYEGMGNNPIIMVDPDGGYYGNDLVYRGSNGFRNMEFDDIDENVYGPGERHGPYFGTGSGASGGIDSPGSSGGGGGARPNFQRPGESDEDFEQRKYEWNRDHKRHQGGLGPQSRRPQGSMDGNDEWSGNWRVLSIPNGEVPNTHREEPNNAYMAGAITLSLVLLADDATIVGVIDDIAIPFILLGAYLWQEYYVDGNSNYPGPWSETQPDPTGNKPYNNPPNNGPNFDPETIVKIALIGTATVITMKQCKDNTKVEIRQVHTSGNMSVKISVPIPILKQ